MQESNRDSRQTSYKKYEGLVNLQYKGNNPQEFIRKFKDIMYEVNESGARFNAHATLYHFIHCIQHNPRCHFFLQGLKPDLKDPNFMTDVYHEFAMTEGSTKFASLFNPTFSANTTTSSSSLMPSSSNFNNKKKDDKKNNNDKSGGQSKSKECNTSSSSKDKKQQHKKVFERDEENRIYCKYHNALGNHVARNCSLKPDGASANAIHHQQQPPQQQRNNYLV
ncbi:hypothetical protein PENPOL_c017G00849 [Penicillium polonicum]|uniref:Uncharacterized protein n=1 Tax=Penicillium polonicum TaxID=60169 RepID=A0A1V6N9N2_PENPO|nr:hypothetical protein PENPOL_c017G00849 [Penicillium polonicum]